MKVATPASIGALAVVFAGCISAPATPPAVTPGVFLDLAAVSMAFDQTRLALPADTPFAIDFENRDTVPHNVTIRSGKPGFTGEIFTGPASRTYVFAGLPEGTYQFVCDVHPEMAGTVNSGGSAR